MFKLNYFPIALNLENRKVLVVGGGKVAQRKVESLIFTKAKIKVVAPSTTVKLKSLSAQGEIKIYPRKLKNIDLRCLDLVIAATNDPEVNKKVSNWARRQKVFVNVVDRPALSSFISPAVLRKDKVTVAVYTNGKDPVLSRDLKNYLKEKWNDFLSYRDKLQNS